MIRFGQPPPSLASVALVAIAAAIRSTTIAASPLSATPGAGAD